jgi:hypothetical protein
MYAEDGKIIINPFMEMDDNMRKAIIRNETVRGFLRQRNLMPIFDLTPKQSHIFRSMNGGRGYGNDTDIRSTIVGRILSGDKSALDVTREQEAYADEIRKAMGW